MAMFVRQKILSLDFYLGNLLFEYLCSNCLIHVDNMSWLTENNLCSEKVAIVHVLD